MTSNTETISFFIVSPTNPDEQNCDLTETLVPNPTYTWMSQDDVVRFITNDFIYELNPITMPSDAFMFPSNGHLCGFEKSELRHEQLVNNFSSFHDFSVGNVTLYAEQ